MQISTKSQITRGDDHVEAPMEGEFALMHVETGKFFAVRDVTADIWRLIEEPKAVSEIVTSLTGIYEVTPDECTSDLLDVLAALQKQGLIKVA